MLWCPFNTPASAVGVGGGGFQGQVLMTTMITTLLHPSSLCNIAILPAQKGSGRDVAHYYYIIILLIIIYYFIIIAGMQQGQATRESGDQFL
jgi:hypothetical protein